MRNAKNALTFPQVMSNTNARMQITIMNNDMFNQNWNTAGTKELPAELKIKNSRPHRLQFAN
jgi:hypothetical protein